MNKNHVKGQLKETKGKIKQEVGHATGNASLETQGIADQIKGKLEKSLGNVKDAVKKGVDSLLHPSKS